ncbi:hypothetical protein IAT38_000948 [Cryptococcus sp. DSM 104549]
MPGKRPCSNPFINSAVIACYGIALIGPFILLLLVSISPVAIPTLNFITGTATTSVSSEVLGGSGDGLVEVPIKVSIGAGGGCSWFGDAKRCSLGIGYIPDTNFLHIPEELVQNVTESFNPSRHRGVAVNHLATALVWLATPPLVWDLVVDPPFSWQGCALFSWAFAMVITWIATILDSTYSSKVKSLLAEEHTHFNGESGGAYWVMVAVSLDMMFVLVVGFWITFAGRAVPQGRGRGNTGEEALWGGGGGGMGGAGD